MGLNVGLERGPVGGIVGPDGVNGQSLGFSSGRIGTELGISSHGAIDHRTDGSQGGSQILGGWIPLPCLPAPGSRYFKTFIRRLDGLDFLNRVDGVFWDQGGNGGIWRSQGGRWHDFRKDNRTRFICQHGTGAKDLPIWSRRVIYLGMKIVSVVSLIVVLFSTPLLAKEEWTPYMENTGAAWSSVLFLMNEYMGGLLKGSATAVGQSPQKVLSTFLTDFNSQDKSQWEKNCDPRVTALLASFSTWGEKLNSMYKEEQETGRKVVTEEVLKERDASLNTFWNLQREFNSISLAYNKRTYPDLFKTTSKE